MAELDIEETNELLRNLNRTIADLSGQLGGLSNGATAASRAYRAQTDAQGKASQGMDGLTRSTKGLTEAELARIDAQKKIAAAEAQIPAARTGASQQDIAIAELQSEIARNQLWQTQLNRDKLLDLNPEFRGGYSNQLSVESSVLQATYGVAIADAAIETTANRGWTRTHCGGRSRTHSSAGLVG